MALKKKTQKSRRPTFGAAIRMARIIDEMPGHPFGWALGDLCEYLGVSERTLRRYVKALSEEFVDEEGQPQFVIERRGEQLRLVRKPQLRRELPESVYHLISVYLSLEFFRMLGENVVALSVEDVFDRSKRRLSQKHRDLLRDLPRKFYTAPWAPKDYSEHVDILEDVIKAIVFQNTIGMMYKPVGGEEWHYTVDPLTLLYHKGGFYLIARSVHHKQPSYYNIERIKKIEITKDKFSYPKNYHPGQMLDGAFGIFRSDECEVKEFKLKFPAELNEYITSRKWHKSQKYSLQDDGSVVLTLRVADSEEVRSWIRSFGDAVAEV